MTNKTQNWEKELSEYGVLHNEDCCVNFEDSRSCDVGTGYADCCENMQMIAGFISSILSSERQKIKEEATKTFKKYSEQLHGGGNGRRIFIELESDILSQLK